MHDQNDTEIQSRTAGGRLKFISEVIRYIHTQREELMLSTADSDFDSSCCLYSRRYDDRKMKNRFFSIYYVAAQQPSRIELRSFKTDLSICGYVRRLNFPLARLPDSIFLDECSFRHSSVLHRLEVPLPELSAFVPAVRQYHN